MIVAIQAGRRDKDPSQTRSHLESALRGLVVPGDILSYVSQRNTMTDQVVPVASDLGLDVMKITCNFKLYGVGALSYAWTTLIDRSDKFMLLSEDEYPCTMDLDFLSHVEFYGYPCIREVVTYERTVVL